MTFKDFRDSTSPHWVAGRLIVASGLAVILAFMALAVLGNSL